MTTPSVAPGSLVVSSSGWKLTAPVAIVSVLLGALASDKLRDPPATKDVQTVEVLVNERFRLDVRQELEAQRRAAELDRAEVRNRLVALEAAIIQWRKFGPQPSP